MSPGQLERGEQAAIRAERLAEGRRAARERYALIAECLKREAGVHRHYPQKSISGVAWPHLRVMVAPQGITRKQLYVLAHECAHVLLHSTPEAARKPGHVMEHEAEVYAHRAFARYGLEVPEKSARWARAYVGQWIMKDHKAGLPICPMAAEWALGRRDANAPLPAVDGQPKQDFSKALDRTVARALKVIEKAEAGRAPNQIQSGGAAGGAAQDVGSFDVPNACGTCAYFEASKSGTESNWHNCRAHGARANVARFNADLCNYGASWRPSEQELRRVRRLNRLARSQGRGFWARLGDVIIERLSRKT